ncbi:hypothetical protein, partial [Pseudomonas protegens]|uniref:hypothetical protein n=1 Tax=Pseudomonas protegens TaxID=380021 RepID=UPI00227F3C2F
DIFLILLLIKKILFYGKLPHFVKCFIVNLKTYTTLYAHSDSFATPFPESYQDNPENLSVNGCSETLYPAMPELGCWDNLAATISKREW